MSNSYQNELLTKVSQLQQLRNHSVVKQQFVLGVRIYLNITWLNHRCLLSCVATRARRGYIAFDAELRKAYFVTLHIRLCVRKHAYAIRDLRLRFS